jgi:hypothetical protein
MIRLVVRFEEDRDCPQLTLKNGFFHGNQSGVCGDSNGTAVFKL